MSPQTRSARCRHAAAVLFAALLALTGCRTAPREITIGVIAMLEGQNAGSGKAMTNAATLAVGEVNARGGLRIGREKVKVALLVENDPNTPEGALDAARKAFSQ